MFDIKVLNTILKILIYFYRVRRNLTNQRVVETLIRNEIAFCTVAFRAELECMDTLSRNHRILTLEWDFTVLCTLKWTLPVPHAQCLWFINWISWPNVTLPPCLDLSHAFNGASALKDLPVLAAGRRDQTATFIIRKV